MKKITALIVDDEEVSRQTLYDFLQRYCPDIGIIHTASSVSNACGLILSESPELVFLDINMPHENGFELFRHFPSPDFHIIFVSAYDEYAIRAFKHGALDYILKPVNIDELINAVSRAVRFSGTKNSSGQIAELLKALSVTRLAEKIALPLTDGFMYVSVQEIVRCEAIGNYTAFFIDPGKKVIVSRTLGSYEAQLTEYGFIRVHHHHLINPKYVERYQRGRGGIITMSDQKEVVVSQRRRDDFLKCMNNPNNES